jgi:hypothetical protein
MPGTTRACYDGAPGTQDVGVCRAGSQSCIAGAGGIGSVWNACSGEVLPAGEVCDGADNDCNGTADNGCACTPGATRACYDGAPGTQGVGACHDGTQSCIAGAGGFGSAWGECAGEVVPTVEACTDGADNDCNGRTDCTDVSCGGMASCPVCTSGGASVSVLRPTEVLFLIDRSGSMNTPMPDLSTRWNGIYNALSAVLPPLDRSFAMGAMIFPTNFDCGAPSAPQVLIQQPSASIILNALSATSPNGQTPTLETLQFAHAYFVANPSPNQRYVVLATDGAPTCTGTVASVVTEITALRTDMGIDTFVIGITGGDATLARSLNQMADAGGMPRTGTTHYYDAAGTSDIEHALRAFTARSTSCTYRLNPVPSPAATVTVRFDGSPVAHDATNGWEFTDGTHTAIQFNGTACGQLTSGAITTLDAGFTC